MQETSIKRTRRKVCEDERARETHKSFCLITGFEPFGGASENPSELVVRSLPGKLVSSCREQTGKHVELALRKRILPTAGVRGWEALKAAIDSCVAESIATGGMDLSAGAAQYGTIIRQVQPVQIILTGLSSGADRIHIERIALNLRDYGIADNDGALVQDSAVIDGGAQLLRTSLALPAIQAVLQDELGFPARVSNHAGTFICNELYYRALAYCRTLPWVSSVVFVHLPPLEKFAATVELFGSLTNARKALSARGSQTRQVALMRQALIALAIEQARQTANKQE